MEKFIVLTAIAAFLIFAGTPMHFRFGMAPNQPPSSPVKTWAVCRRRDLPQRVQVKLGSTSDRCMLSGQRR